MIQKITAELVPNTHNPNLTLNIHIYIIIVIIIDNNELLNHALSGSISRCLVK